MLLVEDCFASQNPAFIEALRTVSSPKVLAAFADRWKKDPRPWARQQIFEYLDLPLNRPGHQPILKRLFKQAEENRDAELLGAFLVAFDTLVRRVRRAHWRWDSATRTSVTEERLSAPRDTISLKAPAVPAPKNGRLFTYRTRYYLRRRTWRFFRWFGYAKPESYAAAVAAALQRYRDDDFAKGENILDSWAMLNICFRHCDALSFSPVHVSLAEGHALAELKPAPRFPKAWETPEAVRVLHGLVVKARSQLVRIWAIEMFRKHRELAQLTPEELLALLDHADERVQQFGAELFDTQGGLEKLPVTTWLNLLQTKNLTALATLCAAFEKNVSATRLTLPQCIELTCAKPVPVARLGFRFLQARQISKDENSSLSALAKAQASVVAAEITTWALARLGTLETYQLDPVSNFFDSLHPEAREAAWAWLTTANSPGYRDPVLWSRLSETPFEDLRLKLVDHLARRADQSDADQLTPVWCSVLLGVHRGGRQKLKAIRQLADVVASEPAKAASLLPVLAVAIRSVRGTEMRAGLAAVMTLVARRPELAPAVLKQLPELKFSTAEAAA